MTTRVGVVLLSGGLDSTTVATLAKSEGYKILALTADYGQVHRRELDAAQAVARALDIEHRVVEVPFFAQLASYSALTNPGDYSVPGGRIAAAMAADVPITYVPMRNTFLLSMAAAMLESVALPEIETGGVAPLDVDAAIFIAANAIDYSGYPDCRPEYYEVLEETLRRGSKLGTTYGVPMQVRTPLLQRSKADIARLAVEAGAPVHLTWSCYRGGERPCGDCDSCQLRAAGFAEAGLPDPALD